VALAERYRATETLEQLSQLLEEYDNTARYTFGGNFYQLQSLEYCAFFYQFRRDFKAI
jgi:hypothetical protein